MVMPSAGTFQYKAIVPVKFDECSWPVQLDQPVVLDNRFGTWSWGNLSLLFNKLLWIQNRV